VSMSIRMSILPLFFQQDVQKENESFKVQIQELKQENCKQVQLPPAVLLTEVEGGGGSLYRWHGKPVVVLTVQIQGQLQGRVALSQLFWLLPVSSCFPLLYKFAALRSFLRLLCSCLALCPCLYTLCRRQSSSGQRRPGRAPLKAKGAAAWGCSSAWLTRQITPSASLFAADLLLMSF